MSSSQSINSDFIKRAAELVIANFDQKRFSGNELAALLHLSREQTHRKLKKDTGLSTGKFILYLRLLKAVHYIQNGNATIAEICYKVGFESPAYFNKCFKETWGISPGEARKQMNDLNLAGSPAYKFYQLPETREVLGAHNITLSLPEKEKKKVTRNNIWLAGTVAIIGLIITTAFLFYKKKTPVVKLVDNSRIAVIPFTNQTGDTTMNQVGEIASSWITGQLDELPGVKTVTYFTIKEYQPYLGILPDDPKDRPTLSELVHAKYFITGSYFLKDQELFFDTRLLDAFSQELIYHMPIIQGSKDSVMQAIEMLRLKIAGLITNLAEVKLGKLNPPNYEAYKDYLKGLEELKVGMYPSKAQSYFEKAVKTEPDLAMAKIFLSWFYMGQQRDSIVQSISDIPHLTKYEQNVYDEFRNLLGRNYKEALSICLSSLEEYPQDYYFNLIAGHRAKSTYHPTLALKVLSQLHDPINNDVGLVWYHFKIWNYVESLNMLGRYNESLAYLQSVPKEFQTQVVPTLAINVDVKLGKTKDEVEHYIQQVTAGNEKLYAEDLAIAAYEFALISENKSSKYFAEKAVDLFRSMKGDKAGVFDLADALYLSKSWKAARAYLKKQLEKDPGNDDLLIYLAMVEASSGNLTAAEKLFSRYDDQPLIAWRRNEFDYQRDYLQARLYALAGNKDKAVQLLKSALTKGQLSHHWDFARDIFLKPLFNYPPFQQLFGIDDDSYLTIME